MKITDIISYSDFINLTKEDIETIVKRLEIDVPEEEDTKHYLYNMRNMIYEDQELNDLVIQRVFAGRTSLKWYKLNFSDEDTLNIIKKIESNENYFDSKANLDTNLLEDIERYTCLKLSDNKYIMRLYVPTGSKTVDNGVDLQKIKTISNTSVIIDIENKILEVRSSSKYANKIATLIAKNLNLVHHEGKMVLGKYKNSIEKFRDALNNGKFIDATSIPDQNMKKLTYEENKLIVGTLAALDQYFMDKELDKLTTSLNEMDPEGVPFTQLLLAGMSKIGMAVKPSDKDDLSKKSLYNLFKGYMTDYSGFITFSLPGKDDNIYTIQVGVKTNTISFRSSVTEEVVDYIKSKIV